MQRRWAAICIAFFLVMGASAFSVMALAEAPTLDVEGDSYGTGDTFQAGGTAYTVSVSEGSAELATTESVVKEESFANGTDLEYRDGTYTVAIEAGEDPDSFALVQAFDVEAVLQDDPQVENSTFTRDDGTESVVYRNGTTQPLEDYLDRDRRTFTEDDAIEHGEVAKTVANVTAERALLTWETDEEQTTGLEEGGTVALGGTEYVATFPDNETLVLSTDVEGYESHEESVDYYQERRSGLLYVVVFSAGSSFLLAALAFLPHRG